MSPEVLTMIVQGGSFALLAYVILWGITKGLPARDAAFQTSLHGLKDDFREEMAAQREHDATRSSAIHSRIDALPDQVAFRVNRGIAGS